MSKKFLRDKPTNVHWQTIKTVCLSHLDCMLSQVPTYMATLSPEEEQAFMSFVEISSDLSILLYRELILDQQNSDPNADAELKLDVDQIEALLRLDVS